MLKKKLQFCFYSIKTYWGELYFTLLIKIIPFLFWPGLSSLTAMCTSVPLFAMKPFPRRDGVPIECSKKVIKKEMYSIKTAQMYVHSSAGSHAYLCFLQVEYFFLISLFIITCLLVLAHALFAPGWINILLIYITYLYKYISIFNVNPDHV